MRRGRFLVRLRHFGRVLGYYLGGLYRRSAEHNLFLLSGGLAFSLSLCFIPLLFIGFAILGRLSGLPGLEDRVVSLLLAVIPYEDAATFVAETVMTRLAEFERFKGVFGFIGVVGTILAASALFGAIRAALNTIFRVPHRSLLIGKLKDLGLIVIVLVYLIAAPLLLPALGVVEEFFGELIRQPEWVATVLHDATITIGSIVLVFGMFYGLFAYVPQRRLGSRTILVSAIASTVLWELARQGFTFYVTNAATLRTIYGTSLLLAVVGLWFYYSGLTLILGAEIGQLYQERRAKLRESVRNHHSENGP